MRGATGWPPFLSHRTGALDWLSGTAAAAVPERESMHRSARVDTSIGIVVRCYVIADADGAQRGAGGGQYCGPGQGGASAAVVSAPRPRAHVHRPAPQSPSSASSRTLLLAQPAGALRLSAHIRRAALADGALTEMLARCSDEVRWRRFHNAAGAFPDQYLAKALDGSAGLRAVPGLVGDREAGRARERVGCFAPALAAPSAACFQLAGPYRGHAGTAARRGTKGSPRAGRC